MVDEVMNLFHTVGALIAGESPQHNQDEVIPSLLGRHPDRFACGSRKGKVRSIGAYDRSFREGRRPMNKAQVKATIRRAVPVNRPVANLSDLRELYSHVGMERYSWSRIFI